MFEAIEQMRVNLGMGVGELEKASRVSAKHYTTMRMRSYRQSANAESTQAFTLRRLAEGLGCEWHLVPKGAAATWQGQQSGNVSPTEKPTSADESPALFEMKQSSTGTTGHKEGCLHMICTHSENGGELGYYPS